MPVVVLRLHKQPQTFPWERTFGDRRRLGWKAKPEAQSAVVRQPASHSWRAGKGTVAAAWGVAGSAASRMPTRRVACGARTCGGEQYSQARADSRGPMLC